MNIDVIAGYVITGVVVLCICYMFFYESIKKDDKNPQANDKYSALYKIAEMIVANFDPNKLPSKDIANHALPKVQEQAQKDGIHVTDDVAKGAIKQVIKDGDDNAKNG